MLLTDNRYFTSKYILVFFTCTNGVHFFACVNACLASKADSDLDSVSVSKSDNCDWFWSRYWFWFWSWSWFQIRFGFLSIQTKGSNTPADLQHGGPPQSSLWLWLSPISPRTPPSLPSGSGTARVRGPARRAQLTFWFIRNAPLAGAGAESSPAWCVGTMIPHPRRLRLHSHST